MRREKKRNLNRMSNRIMYYTESNSDDISEIHLNGGYCKTILVLEVTGSSI